jgi:DNA-binding response OmpR family regulator
MVIDDDKDITDLFSIFLEYNGYIVNAYTNPVEAFNNFRKNSHDLIILDFENAKDEWNVIISQNKKDG